MPLAFQAHEQALLEGAAYRSHVQLWTEDPDGVFVNVTALAGGNWLLGFEVAAEIDQAATSIRAELWREDVVNSIAPLMGGSELNRNAADEYKRFLNAGREFYIRNAITAVGATPTAPQWWELVRGEIDELPHGGRGSRISIVGRDLGGILLEMRTEGKAEYGVDGQLMETAMQLFLNRWKPGVTLYTPVSPGKTIPKLEVEADRPLLEVIREIAFRYTWDVRYLWDEATDAFRLTFYEPPRDKVIPDYTIGPGMYQDVNDLSISRRLVRNAFSVEFLNSATGKRETVTRDGDDSAPLQDSEDEYGRLWMGFVEPDDSPIDTEPEAVAFLEAAEVDVSQPLADQEITMPYFPHVQLGDLLEFEPNNIHYDSAQNFGVVGYRHRHFQSERRTWIKTAGRVVGMHKPWFRRSATRGVFPGSDLKEFSVISETASAIVLGWTPTTDITEEWYAVYSVSSMAGDPWAIARSVVRILMTSDHQLTVSKPPQGQITLVLVQGRRINPITRKWEVLVTWQREVHPATGLAKLIDVVVTDQAVRVTADPNGTQSLKAERIDGGGTWSSHVDGSTYSFSVPVPVTETWTIRVTAYAEPVVEVVSGTQQDTREALVSNGAGTFPVWDTFLVAAPALNLNIISVSLDASSGATAHYFALWIKYPTDPSYTDQITPGANDVPTTLTSYDIQLPITEFSYVRKDPGPGNFLVTFNFKVEMFEDFPSDLLVATEERTLSYYTDGSVLVP